MYFERRSTEVMVDPPEMGGAAEVDGGGSAPDGVERAVLPESRLLVELLGQGCRRPIGPLSRETNPLDIISMTSGSIM